LFDAHVLKVMISSPGDTGDEVAAVTEGLHDWNGSRAEAAQVIVLPRYWKTDAVPRMGPGGGQAVINKQLLDTADIVIALFDSRLGQATPAAVSGTAEEIHRATDAGKFVHVWFSKEPVKHDVDLDQLKAVREYRKILEQSALVGEYTSPSDLALKVRSAIEHDLPEMRLGSPTLRGPVAEHAIPELRQQVASVLADRPKMLDSQRELFDATIRHHLQSQGTEVSPAERSAQLMAVRDKHIKLCEELEHKIIQASLLTNNPKVAAALSSIREAAKKWNRPMVAANRGPGVNDEFDRIEKLQVDLGNAFDSLESATRSITAISF